MKSGKGREKSDEKPFSQGKQNEDEDEAKEKRIDEFIELRRRINELEASEIELRRVEGTLQHRIDMEKLIAGLSTRFITLQPDEIDAGITRALEKVGTFADVDRCYVFTFYGSGTMMDNTHEWCAEGIEPQIQNLKGLYLADYPWFKEKIEKFETFHVPRVRDLPPEGHAEKETFEMQDIQSLIIVPIIYGRSLMGFVGFDSVRKEKTWPEDDIRLLKVVGEIFASAMVRKRAEEELRSTIVRLEEEKAKTEGIISALGDGVVIQDTDFNIVYQNEIQKDLYGDHVGEYCYKAYSGRDTICEDCPVERSFKEGSVHKITKKTATSKGILFFELTVSPLRDHTGKIIAGIKVVRNITDLKRAEEGVREGERFLANIFASIQDGIGIIDKEMNILRVNPTAERWYQYAGPLVGRKCYEAYHGRTERCEVCPAWRTLSTGKSAYEVICKHGPGGQEVGWLEIYSFPMLDTATGEMKGAIEYVRDITERKKMEGKLRRAHDELERRVHERTAELANANKALLNEITERRWAEEKIREQAALIDNAQDAFAVLDLQHRIVYCNKSAERLYEWTKKNVIGKSVNEYLCKEDSLQLDDAKKSVIGKGKWRGELRHRTKNGREIIVENYWTLVQDSEGVPKSILVISTDITERKKLEAQLLRTQRMESIGTLAGGIAHDINNVLTPIMLSLELLREKFPEEESQRLINILERSSKRGSNLVKQVMSFARGVEGERKLLHASHIIQDIEKIIRETFPRSIEINATVQKDIFPVSGDPTQLNQVLMNLCVNARDAMPDGGLLSISAEDFFIDNHYASINIEAKAGQYIVLSVEDTGHGIPEELLDRIFEPFFTTKEPGKGTGLGLSTALAIVKSHGGFIDMESAVGKGSTFRIYLPAAPAAEIPTVQSEHHELPMGNGESILVVDDETQIREITRATLEEYGYRVLTACDGREALALYSQQREEINLVVIDMIMPILDGPSCIRELRKMNQEVKILAVSGVTEKEKIASENIREWPFLMKPYTSERLLKSIHEVLRMG